MPVRGQAAYIEIVERRADPIDTENPTGHPGAGIIKPNEVRINGVPVLCPADAPVVVHEMALESDDIVKVTLTLWARRVVIGQEALD